MGSQLSPETERKIDISVAESWKPADGAAGLSIAGVPLGITLLVTNPENPALGVTVTVATLLSGVLKIIDLASTKYSQPTELALEQMANLPKWQRVARRFASAIIPLGQFFEIEIIDKFRPIDKRRWESNPPIM